MAGDEQGDRGFTVKDRRRFSPETGEPRADSTEEEPERAPASGRSAAAAGSGPGAESGADTSAPSSTEARTEPPADSAGQHAQLPEITLSTFILSMSTQALMHMGEIEGPGGETGERDMNAARQVIDILGMLREKTKGNLEQNEEALFDHLLYDLRIRFVELSKTGRRQ